MGGKVKTLNEELAYLRELKTTAENDGANKKESDKEFKQHMAKCLERMEIEECEAHRSKSTGYLFSVVNKVKGQIEDRRPYVRWALENDPAIDEFLAKWGKCAVDDDTEAEFAGDFFDAITSTSVVTYKENGDTMNQQARAHVDDGAPLPPGLTFRPDPYISMRKS
jgi:hypothetical protein